jgi:putative ABC transport system permease protein
MDIRKRELRGGLHGFRIFLAFALGVAAIAAVGTVRASIQRALPPMVQHFGRAVVRFTYRLPTPMNAWMASIAEKVSETTDFRP